jgi:3D-(3,5/4)-trihydroxycyclohexane-1,2-dione acylhydrolase (decyclizing)
MVGGSAASVSKYVLVVSERALVRADRAQNDASRTLPGVGAAESRRAFACTSSTGPGATNMFTGAATATVNRIPVLLLCRAR